LTGQLCTAYNPFKTRKEVFAMGNIRCSKCGKRREKPGTCECGGFRVYISIFWKGRAHKVWRFTDNHLLDFERAQALLGNIRVAISNKIFDPTDFSKTKMDEMLLENKIAAWLKIKEAELQQDIIRPSSYKNMVGHISNYIIPGLGDSDVRHISKDDLRMFRDSLGSEIKNKTKKNIFVTLHAFFSWLSSQEVRPMPAFPELAGESDASERQALEPEEQQAALNMIPEGIERDMIELGMELGIRPGELVSLKIGDFNLREKIGHVNRTVSAYSYVLEGTKGRTRGKARKKRRILLSDRATEIITKQAAGRFGAEWLLICPATKRRYSVKAPNRIWKKYTGLDVTYYEASRHSLATQLAGVMDAYDLALVFGWSDIRTPQKYVHRKLEALRGKINSRSNVIELQKKEAQKT
jgi:integrase